MKLIIDIPEEEYKTLSKMSEKEKANELSYYEKIIANGIPYEPKGDLISREALKKAFEEVYPLATNEMGGVVNKDIYDIIDNAPTVNAGCDAEYVASIHYEAGYIAGTHDTIRPQGEWIENLDSRNDEMQASCYCSECGASCYCATDKFCHECGADMRGKEE